jgi:Cu(I)/Ag(I) efflux system protein CusF
MRYIALSLALLFAGAACAQTPAAQPPAAEAAVKTAAATGVIKEIDAKTGLVLIKHDPIESLGWPEMTMNFRVVPAELLKDVKVGDKIKFETTAGPGLPEVRAIKKQ